MTQRRRFAIALALILMVAPVSGGWGQEDTPQGGAAPESGQAEPAAPRAGPPFGRGPGRGRGPGMQRGPGMGMGRGPRHDERFAEDHNVFFFLLEHREAIRRTVTDLPNGIETVTESDNSEVAGKIQEHVAAMYERLENGNPIHMRDPLFREIFANAKKISMEMTETEQGIRVKETSDDPYVVKLLQAHAQVVSLFLKNGHAELPRNHEVPPREAAPRD
jgi:hypothetical protein